jgi:TRAP transporter TAXI family solute receptor
MAAVLLAIGVLAPHAATAIEELRFFRIGTAATTGTYFQIGGVLASAISKPPGSRDCERGGSCGVPGLVAVAQATQGSIQNILQVSARQLESALSQSDVAYWAYTGTSLATPQLRCKQPHAAENVSRNSGMALLKNRGPVQNLRAITALYPENVHVVVRGDGPIRTLADLKGMRVALGEPESGTLADARLVLEAANLSECDLKPQYLRLSQAAESLSRGDIDAFFLVAGYPVPAVADVAATVPIRLLPVAGDTIQRLARKFPFFATDLIPAGTYPGQDADVATASTTALWIVAAEVQDDLVYDITKSLWRDATKRLLESSHPAGKRIRLADALQGVVIPLHPGAARFYTEAGMKLPEPH